MLRLLQKGLKGLITAHIVLLFLLSGKDSYVHAQTTSTIDRRVIVVSVDGLRSDEISKWGSAALPGFYRLINEGAYTLNARPDPDYSVTLPNHISMVTGRFVLGSDGHGWTDSVDPMPFATVHGPNGQYVPSMFDVVHDAGGRTALFSMKTKFSLFDNSYDGLNGAPDLEGTNNGRDKIDTFFYHWSSTTLLAEFTKGVGANAYDLAFIHLGNPDSAGHATGWSDDITSNYAKAVRQVDVLLTELVAFVESNSAYSGKTTIILTADHGGLGQNHSSQMVQEVYSIPFIVWHGNGTSGSGSSGGGASGGSSSGGAQGAQGPIDLYGLNAASRANPGTNHVSRAQALARPPIRNADAANLALDIMGLPSIPGS
ncbi:MAG: alkaline phosphatase family protein, partial [Bacteroidetes bacterium]|nr:alkaline phosphatase family protein [Bacteroidota bacterium]